MNARQKAKKYKKELEELKELWKLKPKIQLEEKRRDVKTLATVITVDLDDLNVVPPDEYFQRQLLKQLTESDEFKRAVTFEADAVDKYYGQPRRITKTYKARVDIVVK